MRCMTVQERTVRIATWNAWGLKRKLQEAQKLSNEVAILGETETSLSDNDVDVVKGVNGCSNAARTSQANRGHGGMSVIISRALKVIIIGKYAKGNIQTMTVSIREVTISTVYFSSKSQASKEQSALSEIIQMAGPKAVNIGDLNGRHRL